ncbi:MAG: DUF4102 domain-containing protein [Rhodospirillales bacterium]|nr:DUF4102 domain-containing protein [Rhodospirillales bacterium]
MKFTERLVAGLKPTERDVFAWDDETPGFGLRIKPSGRKSFIVQYRTNSGVSRRYTLGPCGVLKLEAARAKARKALVAVKDGADPASERKADRNAETVTELCDRYLAEHVKLRNRESTAREFGRLIECHIKPELGRSKVKDVTRENVMKLHRKLSETPRQANQVVAVLSKMFHLAEAWRLRPDHTNPCRLVERYAESKRERFLSEPELARLGVVLGEVERNATEHPNIVTAIRLLLLTGCRLSEVLTLKWEHVDIANACLRLPVSKTGAKTVALGAPAVRLLSAHASKSDYVLPALIRANEPLPVATIEKAWRRIKAKAELPDVRLHDFRHTSGTYAGQAGANAFLVRDLLGHKTLAMTARYVGRDADPLRALADKVSERIAAAMSGHSGEVVALRRVSNH